VKYNLIRYRHTNGPTEDWHQEIARFVAALDADPDLSGRISYRAMKGRDGYDYYHLAVAADDEAAKTLADKDFFTRYTERVDLISGGTVEVLPLEVVAETAFRA